MRTADFTQEHTAERTRPYVAKHDSTAVKYITVQ